MTHLPETGARKLESIYGAAISGACVVWRLVQLGGRPPRSWLVTVVKVWVVGMAEIIHIHRIVHVQRPGRMTEY